MGSLDVHKNGWIRREITASDHLNVSVIVD